MGDKNREKMEDKKQEDREIQKENKSHKKAGRQRDTKGEQISQEEETRFCSLSYSHSFIYFYVGFRRTVSS